MRLNLKNKTRLLSAAVIISFGLFGGMMLGRLALVTGTATEIAEHLMPLAKVAWLLRWDSLDFRLQEARFLMFQDAENMAIYERLMQRQLGAIRNDFAEFIRQMPPAEDRTLVTNLQAAWERFVADEEPIIAAARANRKDEALRLYPGSSKRLDVFRPQLFGLYEQINHRVEKASENAQGIYASAFNVVLGLLVVGLLVVIASAMYVERAVTRAILRLSGCMERLAEGELSVSVPETARTDEIGRIATTLEVFKQNAIAMRGMEKSAAELLRTGDEERERAEVERQAKVTRQAIMVDALMGGFHQLSAGNLTFELTTPFSPPVDKLRLAYNGVVVELQAKMSDVVEHSVQIDTASLTLSTAVQELSACTQTQAGALEQAIDAVQLVRATVQQAAEGSAQARTVAATAKAEVESSESVVQQAVSAMSEIEGSAREIGNIIGLIDDIAFQTNLLALNAGVEAARAGETGRGFAVVATEVRALAQRAAAAAKEIKTLINTSMQQVERGVRLVGETGAALGRIQSGVLEINTAITGIAASAAKQSAGLAEVDDVVGGMNRMAQRQTSALNEAVAAMATLDQEVGAMREAIGQFQLADSPDWRAAA
jgi:methyl-accepting chemotaxis protein